MQYTFFYTYKIVISRFTDDTHLINIKQLQGLLALFRKYQKKIHALIEIIWDLYR